MTMFDLVVFESRAIAPTHAHPKPNTSAAVIDATGVGSLPLGPLVTPKVPGVKEVDNTVVSKSEFCGSPDA